MTSRVNRLLLLSAALGLLTGCAGNAATTAGSPASSANPRASATAAMVMPADAAPSDTQALICGDEIRETVQSVLGLKSEPLASPTMMNGLYTCTYELPMGSMRLSVQHTASKAAAQIYLTDRSAKVHAEKALAGLGEGAFGTGTGVVLTVKDNEVLEVDTTALPRVFGNQGQRRTDLAYEIASDVLGCWTE